MTGALGLARSPAFVEDGAGRSSLHVSSRSSSRRCSRPGTFASVLGRRGAKAFGAGLLILSAILALSCTGQLPRTMTYVLIVPFFLAGLTTVTGLVLTILALLVAGGPDRRLGWLFIAAVPGLLSSDPLTSALASREARRTIGLAIGALASSGFLAAFAGMGVLAIRRDRAADASGAPPGEGEMRHAAG